MFISAMSLRFVKVGQAKMRTFLSLFVKAIAKQEPNAKINYATSSSTLRTLLEGSDGIPKRRIHRLNSSKPSPGKHVAGPAPTHLDSQSRINKQRSLRHNPPKTATSTPASTTTTGTFVFVVCFFFVILDRRESQLWAEHAPTSQETKSPPNASVPRPVKLFWDGIPPPPLPPSCPLGPSTLPPLLRHSIYLPRFVRLYASSASISAAKSRRKEVAICCLVPRAASNGSLWR